MNAECYVIRHLADRPIIVPATVVRETKSTVVVEVKHNVYFGGPVPAYQLTFNKVKVYGKNEYENPRENVGDRASHGSRFLSERGDMSHRTVTLTFDVAHAERVMEREARKQHANDKAQALREACMHLITQDGAAAWDVHGEKSPAILAALEQCVSILKSVTPSR